MPEQRGLYPRMRVAEQLSYFGQQHGMSGKAANAAAGRWLERMGLADRTKSKLEELSHGNQQRVQLATALVHDPELLVLDEPFSGLDPIGIATMTEVVRERAAAGVGVVFSSHQLDLVEDVCEDVVIIARGRIVAAGGIEDLKTASGRQHLEIEVVGSDGAWLDGRTDLTVLERDGGWVKLLVERTVDLDELLRTGQGRRRGPPVRLPAPEAVRTVHGGGRPGARPPRRTTDESLAEHLARGPTRDPRARPEPRVHVERPFTTLIVVGSFVVPAILFGGPDVATIGVVDPAPPALAATVVATTQGADRDIEFVPFPDAPTAEAALTAGEVEAVIDVPTDLSGPGRVVYREEADCVPPERRRRRGGLLRTDGGADRERMSTRPPSWRPARRRPPSSSTRRPRPTRRRFLVANIGAVLILVGIFSFGFTVLTGVVEEKQSRVVEVVLSTVRARDLLMGKVLGIGVLGVFQLVRLRRSPR